MPSVLPTNWIELESFPLRSGAPLGASGARVGVIRLETRRTPGRRAISAVRAGLKANGAPLLLPTEIVTVEVLVLAKKVGYEDCVRRAPAIDPMASPPTSPMRSAMAT